MSRAQSAPPTNISATRTSCTENWKPKSYDPHPDTFAEWFLTGLPKGKRLPPTRSKKDVKEAKGRVSRVKAARKQSEVRG